MKALRIIIIILVVLLGLFFIPPLFMPGEIRIEKSMIMPAEPEVIFDQVNCFRNWGSWNPWREFTQNVTYEGPECGEGSKMIWEDKSGKSTQTITESTPYTSIKTALNFMEQDTMYADWIFEETDEGTRVTWNFHGPAPYPTARWFSTLLIKPEVEKRYKMGLDSLNAITKGMKPKPKFITGTVEIKEVKSMDALAVREETTAKQMGEVMGADFGKLMAYATKNGAEVTGPPFAIWYKWDSDTFVFDDCIPVSKKLKNKDDIKAFKTYKGRVAAVQHTGDYSTTGNSWSALDNYIKQNNLETNGDPYEVYLTDPQSEPDSTKWITMLYWPVK